jgi:hypothetical protein
MPKKSSSSSRAAGMKRKASTHGPLSVAKILKRPRNSKAKIGDTAQETSDLSTVQKKVTNLQKTLTKMEEEVNAFRRVASVSVSELERSTGPKFCAFCTLPNYGGLWRLYPLKDYFKAFILEYMPDISICASCESNWNAMPMDFPSGGTGEKALTGLPWLYWPFNGSMFVNMSKSLIYASCKLMWNAMPLNSLSGVTKLEILILQKNDGLRIDGQTDGGSRLHGTLVGINILITLSHIAYHILAIQRALRWMSD